jgi:FkbM family methyltransferase
MQPENDPFWQAAAAHVTGLGLAGEAVFAALGFEGLLPGCRTIHNAPDGAVPAALVLHKGRLEEVPADLLRAALDTHVTSFANEVFLVLSASGAPLAADDPHIISAEALLAAMGDAHRDNTIGGVRLASQRMAASYVGQGRVLLETAFGHLMLVDGADTGIVPHLIRDGWFDRNLTTVIGNLLKPGATFVDVGANFGTYTIFAAEKVGPRGSVFAIEPSPDIFPLLFESVAMNGFEESTTSLRCAAGAKKGEAVLHQFGNRKGGNTLLPHIAEAARERYGETVTPAKVATRTLDDIFAELNPDRIDLIKIDVEGSEADVLAGARETLWAYRPKLVIEWNNHFFTDRPEAAEALYTLITRDLRYSLHRIEPGATTRPIGRAELMEGFHDLVAEPPE